MPILCALLLNACATVMPAYRDNGPCIDSSVQGGPDSAVQQFYDYRIQYHDNDITALRSYLSGKLATLLSDASCNNSHRELLSNDPFSSRTALPDSAHAASAPTIPSHDVRNIPLRVDLKQDDQGW